MSEQVEPEDTGWVSADTPWADMPDSLKHLAPDAPNLVCSGCGRKTWSSSDVGEVCGMSQPDGSKCQGVFGLPPAGD